jgi:hypothetical protein
MLSDWKRCARPDVEEKRSAIAAPTGSWRRAGGPRVLVAAEVSEGGPQWRPLRRADGARGAREYLLLPR